MANLLTKKVIFRMTIAVALPPIVLGVPARLLDKNLGTSPWILLAAILIALHISLVIVIFQLRKLLAETQ